MGRAATAEVYGTGREGTLHPQIVPLCLCSATGSGHTALSCSLQGKMLLPGVEDQEADVEAHRVWKRSFAPPSQKRAANLMVREAVGVYT